MKNEKLTRRDFFARASVVGAVTVSAGSLLAACGGGESESSSATPPPSASEPMAAPDCTDLTGLSDTDIATRSSLQYVDETPNPDQRCDNCQLYVMPEGDSACGGCQIIKGPIAPAGYCISWAAKQA
ncbi:MAG: hypothetical protein HKN43_00965 [Rhodothermales bacterium]|nr:hypothetical protein [Rhodothermales bacterium]